MKDQTKEITEKAGHQVKEKKYRSTKKKKNGAVIKSENSKIYLRKKKKTQVISEQIMPENLEKSQDTDIKTLKHKDLKNS